MAKPHPGLYAFEDLKKNINTKKDFEIRTLCLPLLLKTKQ